MDIHGLHSPENLRDIVDTDGALINISDVSKNVSQAVNKQLNVVTMWLMVYVLPVIFCFGIFGNSVSFVLFMSAKMRRVSTNVYLAALSASNSVFLLAVAVSWTDLVGLKLMHRNGVCQASVYLAYCSGFLSVWLVVVITVENFIINFFLHKASRHCTVRRAVNFLVLLCMSSFLLYDFALWTTGIVSVNGGETQYCATYNEYQAVVELFTFVDVTLTLIVPSFVILILVIPTCIKHLTRKSRAGATSASVMLSRKERALMRVTRLLCVIIVSFVMLTTPDHLNKLRHLFLGQRSSSKKGSSDMLVMFIVKVFYHLSFSVNFVYFLIWGKNFRYRFCCLFTALRRQLSRCGQKLCFIDE